MASVACRTRFGVQTRERPGQRAACRRGGDGPRRSRHSRVCQVDSRRRRRTLPTAQPRTPQLLWSRPGAQDWPAWRLRRSRPSPWGRGALTPQFLAGPERAALTCAHECRCNCQSRWLGPPVPARLPTSVLLARRPPPLASYLTATRATRHAPFGYPGCRNTSGSAAQSTVHTAQSTVQVTKPGDSPFVSELTSPAPGPPCPVRCAPAWQGVPPSRDGTRVASLRPCANSLARGPAPLDWRESRLLDGLA